MQLIRKDTFDKKLAEAEQDFLAKLSHCCAIRIRLEKQNEILRKALKKYSSNGSDGTRAVEALKKADEV